MSKMLESGKVFNRSPRVLRWTAITVAIGWLLACLAIAGFVAQYFVCIGYCAPGTPPVELIAISALFGLMPGVLTAGLGYFIVRGLWEDARVIAEEEAQDEASEPKSAPARSRSVGGPSSGQQPVA
jgi:hypothetical protein